MTIKIHEPGSYQVWRVRIPMTLRPSCGVSHHPKRKSFFKDRFLSSSEPLAHGPPVPLPQHMACISKYPTPFPLHPHQGPFSTIRSPSNKFLPNRPSVPHSATLEVSEPRSQGRTGLICCKAVAWSAALALGEVPTRDTSFPGQKEAREGRPTARGRKPRPKAAVATE